MLNRNCQPRGGCEVKDEGFRAGFAQCRSVTQQGWWMDTAEQASQYQHRCFTVGEILSRSPTNRSVNDRARRSPEASSLFRRTRQRKTHSAPTSRLPLPCESSKSNYWYNHKCSQNTGQSLIFRMTEQPVPGALQCVQLVGLLPDTFVVRPPSNPFRQSHIRTGGQNDRRSN